MSDSRTRLREGCLVHGQILSPELPAPIDCTIWDISHEGARLILPEGATIPDKLRISTPFSSIPRKAEVCWRAGTEAGIRLLEERASSAEDALAEQIRNVEQSNADLVKQLRDLQRRLQRAEIRAGGASLHLKPDSESSNAGRTAKADRAFTYVLDDDVRILVTDDDPILREFARVHLTTPSASVEVAESAEDGLTRLAESRFDIALIDLEMPGIGGLEMIKRLRANPAHADLPVVVVTGRDDMRSIDLAYEAGATSFVTKPVNWRLMSYQLRYVLRAQRSYRGRGVAASELPLAG